MNFIAKPPQEELVIYGRGHDMLLDLYRRWKLYDVALNVMKVSF